MKKNSKPGTIKTLEGSKLNKKQMHSTTGGYGTTFNFYDYDGDWCGTGPKPLPWPTTGPGIILYY